MNNLKTLSLSVLLATLTTTAAMAGTSGNVGVTSNYMWRGLTQSNDKAAVSGGIDTELANGFSFGTWASSLDGSTEVDIYGAYGGKIGGLDYTLGLSHYHYPSDATDDHFSEVNTSLKLGPVSLGLDYTFDSKDNSSAEFSEGDLHYSLSASKKIKPGLSLGGTLGHYDFDNAAGDDYSYGQLNLSKGDFTLAVDKTSGRTDVDAPRVSLSWAHSIDF